MAPQGASPEVIRTTKSGTDLQTFQDVNLYKKVPKVPAPTSVDDALARLGNDNGKLLAIIGEGLQAEAVRNARESNSGWLLFDENDKETETVFAGSLANSEDVNPVVLMFAKLNFGFDDAKNADEKRAAKNSAKEQIRSMPQVLDGLRKKAEAAQK